MEIERYHWWFGDGLEGDGRTPKHQYKMAGTYPWKVVGYETMGNEVSDTGEVEVTESDISGGMDLSRTNKCYCLGLTAEQGVGFHERDGSAWPMPEALGGTLDMYDDYEQPQLLVVDNNTGKLVNITTRDGPVGQGLEEVHKDGVSSSGTGGTNVAPAVDFADDRGSTEHLEIEHKLSHVYVRPLYETNRDETGYDSAGYPSGLELDLNIYKDGEPTTAKATVSDFPKDGDISFDKKCNGHRLRLKLSANMGEHIIVGRDQSYAIRDRAAGPSKQTMSHHDYQSEMATPSFWPCWINSVLKNRVTGRRLSVGRIEVTTGPAGDQQAMEFWDVISWGNKPLSASATIMVWVSGTVDFRIGGGSLPLTTLGSTGEWYLKYIAAGGTAYAGDFVMVPSSGSGQIYDLRMYSGEISAAALNYYYNDILNNSGNTMGPKG